MASTATLTVDGKSFEMPVIIGTENEKGLDIGKLRQQTGYITYDPGLGNSGACTSNITFIDGEKGILRYRGIPIEQFEQAPNFIEVAYLLIFGKLPTTDEYKPFSERLTRNAHLHEGMRHAFQAFPPGSPPMACLSAMFNVLACYHKELFDIENHEVFAEAAARMISKVRTVAAYIYRHAKGLPFIYPDPNLSYCANFMHMMFSAPYRQVDLDPEVVKALNLILILHADHEQNCSTSTVRVVCSSQANIFTSVAAGISALWGRLHGGANMEVLEQLEQIHQGGRSIDALIEDVKAKKDRLMGFGHRVYKSFDPRARILAKVAERLLPRMKVNDPLLDIARKLEERALKDQYFVDRNLYPNVDFYSGILMRAMGIPVDMFTVIFAIGRLPGWLAHWKEQHEQGGGRIFRPRQIYTGNTETRFVPISERK